MLVRLKQGRVTVEIELKGIEKLTRGIERAAARIAVALIVAAFATQLAPASWTSAHPPSSRSARWSA